MSRVGKKWHMHVAIASSIAYLKSRRNEDDAHAKYKGDVGRKRKRAHPGKPGNGTGRREEYKAGFA
jgi:hypothetical protein